jgi:diguanylate cyclase (GGDEF)-like protein
MNSPAVNHSRASTIDCSEAVCLVDRRGRLIAADSTVSGWLVRAGEIQMTTLSQILEGDLRPTLEMVFAGADEQTITAGLRAAGRTEPAVVNLRRLVGADGPVVLVTIRRCGAAAAMSLDALTGLPDRRAIAATVESWRATRSGAASRFAVLFVDLDNFKQVNDRHGHALGDQVLKLLAARWLGCVREDDLEARYGGDEFVLLIKDVGSLDDVAPVVRRLQAATAEPLDIDGVRLQLSATIGATIADSPDASVDALIAAADRDMYARKPRLPR